MRSPRTSLCFALVALTGLALGVALAQDSKKSQEAKAPAAPAASKEPAMPPMPKPGPEQAILKRGEGVWEARVEMRMGPPGTPPEVSTGVETNTLVGGLWLITDYKGSMAGTPFQGHGTMGYDAALKKYVGIWVDSMSTSLSRSEGDFDPKSNTLTMVGQTIGEDGKPMKFREVLQWPDPNTRAFTMYMAGPDGREIPGMTITYKRKS
jgi:Protein of unknown function (DUF1579)